MPYAVIFDLYHDGRTVESYGGYDSRDSAEADVDRLMDEVPRLADAAVSVVNERDL